MSSSEYYTPGEAEYPEYAEYDGESFDEDYSEARPRPRARNLRPIVPPAAKTAYQARPSPSNVTQAQLQAALARVSAQINSGAAAVKAVDVRVRGVAGETERNSSALRREIADRKKEILGVRKDLQSTREMSAMIPLLSSLGGGGPMAAVMPMLLMGGDVSNSDGNGSGGGTSGGGLFGGGSTGMIAMLALMGGLK